MPIIKPSTAFKSFDNWVSGEVRAYMKDQVSTHVDRVQDVRDNDFEYTRFIFVKSLAATFRFDPSSGAADDGVNVLQDNIGRRYVKVTGTGLGGVDFDAQVADLAGRALYDGEPEGFVVLVSDVGDGRAALYSKNSNTSADWSEPAYVTGTQGTTGDIGGAAYRFDDGTTDANPGAGNLRADNADLSAATMLFVSKTNRYGDDLSGFLASLTGSTSSHKGYLILTAPDSETQAVFGVTGLTDATGYVKLSVSAHGGATAFTDAERLAFLFARTGNAGDLNGVSPGVFGLEMLEAETAEEGNALLGIFNSKADAEAATIPASQDYITVGDQRYVRITDTYAGLGPEIVVGANYQLNTGWSYAGGILSKAAGVVNGAFQRDTTLPIGGTFFAKVVADTITGADFRMSVGGNNAITGISAPGTYTGVSTITTNDDSALVANTTSAAGTFSLVSVRRMPDTSIQSADGAWWGPATLSAPLMNLAATGAAYSASPNYVDEGDGPVAKIIWGSTAAPTESEGAALTVQKISATTYSGGSKQNTAIAALARKYASGDDDNAKAIFGEVADYVGSLVGSNFIEGGRFHAVLNAKAAGATAGSAYGVLAAAMTEATGTVDYKYLVACEAGLRNNYADAPLGNLPGGGPFAVAFLASNSGAYKSNAGFATNPNAVDFRYGFLAAGGGQDVACFAGYGSVQLGLDLGGISSSVGSIRIPYNQPILGLDGSSTNRNLLYMSSGGNLVVGQGAAALQVHTSDMSAGTVRSVTMGDADSGGTGFRALRVPNA